MTKKIGICGVGLMGLGIAGNVLKNGFALGYLRHPGNQPTDDLDAGGALGFDSAAALAQASDIVIICVTGSPQVHDVLLSANGILQGLKPGSLVIDCSTAIPGRTKELSEKVIAAGGRFMDAPMTRTPKEAAEGRLNLIVGGDADDFAEVKPLLEAFAENIVHAGPIGAGHTMKLIHNFVSLGFSALLAEASVAATASGVDPHILHDVLNAGGGKSVVLDRMSPYLLENDLDAFRFSISNSDKDLGYYTDMARELGVADAIAAAVGGHYRAAVEAGAGDRFVPELIDLLKKDEDIENGKTT